MSASSPAQTSIVHGTKDRSCGRNPISRLLFGTYKCCVGFFVIFPLLCIFAVDVGLEGSCLPFLNYERDKAEAFFLLAAASKFGSLPDKSHGAKCLHPAASDMALFKTRVHSVASLPYIAAADEDHDEMR